MPDTVHSEKCTSKIFVEEGRGGGKVGGKSVELTKERCLK